jgi:hypothetical protein
VYAARGLTSRTEQSTLADNSNACGLNKKNGHFVRGSIPHHERKIEEVQESVSVRPEVYPPAAAPEATRVSKGEQRQHLYRRTDLLEALVMGEMHKSKRMEKVALGCLLSLVAVGLLITGCASQQTAFQTQLDLGSCGFQWKVAETPEKLKQLEALPQRKLLRHEKNGKFYYIYADVRDCKCVYVGDEKAFQQYKQFVFQQRQDSKLDVEAAETAGVDMGSFWEWYGLFPSNY